MLSLEHHTRQLTDQDFKKPTYEDKKVDFSKILKRQPNAKDSPLLGSDWEKIKQLEKTFGG
jgi:hypothetical protein